MMRVRGGKAASSETARWERLILWGIVVLAVVLRAWGLSHQLPDKTYIEEDEFIYTALKYGSGDPNPHWFFHPPLYSYLLFALYGAYYLLGAAAGWFRGAEEFILQYLVDPSAFYIIARGLSVLLSVPAVLLLHRFGRNVCSPRVGLAACLLFAVMPLGVKYAHYGCTEPLLLCLVLAAAVCAARALQTGRVRPLLAAGAFAGAAMGTKYTGAFALALVAAAVPPPTRVSSWAALLGAFAAAGAAFLLVCPFPILAPQEFAANVSLLASQPLQVGEYSWQRIPNLYLEFARRHMPVGMTAPLAWISSRAPCSSGCGTGARISWSRPSRRPSTSSSGARAFSTTGICSSATRSSPSRPRRCSTRRLRAPPDSSPRQRPGRGGRRPSSRRRPSRLPSAAPGPAPVSSG